MKKGQELIIKQSASITDALKQMDEVRIKLLIVIDDKGLFNGLVSIGDIQRAIIANADLQTEITKIMRNEFIVGTEKDDLELIKTQMLRHRLAYMPILSSRKEIQNIIFWEDIIREDLAILDSQLINLPVVIMAGGFGTRLRPLTNVLPKPLLPYGEKTILENIIERFEKYGCSNFHVSVNYKAELISYYFNNIEGKSYHINLFTEDQPLGTAGSLGLLKDKLNTSFFVSNCDILIDEDYSAIYEYHKEQGNELTIVASLKHYNIPYGTLETGDKGELLDLQEKPTLTFKINCGVYILEPHLLKEIPANTFFHITDLIEAIKERKGKVGVFPISEKSWIDIGEWPLYAKILMP